MPRREMRGHTARQSRADGTSGTPSPTHGFCSAIRRDDMGIAPYEIAGIRAHRTDRVVRPYEAEQEPRKTGRQKAAWHKKTHGFACVYPAEIDRKNAHMRQHAGVFAANFSSNLLWQNCFAPKKSASCAEPRRVAAGILDVCQGGATTGLRKTRLLRRMFSYARRPNAVPSEFIAPRSFSAAPHRRCSAHTGSHPPR